MPEYAYDPAQGGAVEVSHGFNAPTSDEAPQEGPSVEELSRHRVEQTARGLSNRRNNTHTFGEAEEGSNLQAEIQLQQTQQRLYRREFNSPLEEQALIQECEALASQLTGGSNAPSQPQESEQFQEDFVQEYKNQNPDVDLDLAYAGEVMGVELASSINEVISDNSDELSQVAALEMVKQLRANPANFISRDESTGVSEQQESEIAAEFGEDLAHAVSVLGNGVASNVITPQQAIRTAAQDPALQNCIRSLVASGRLRIAL